MCMYAQIVILKNSPECLSHKDKSNQLKSINVSSDPSTLYLNITV